MKLIALQNSCVSHSTKLYRYFCDSSKRNYLKFEKIMSDKTPLLYPSLDSIKNVFERSENKHVNGVQELLDIYHKVEEKYEQDGVGKGERNPLIVLEGLDGSGKTTVGMRFAAKLGAIRGKTPPESISHIRELFDDNPTLRTAYYSLGNYIAALEVQLNLRTVPVVMDRFWHSTAAYAIAQAVQDHPDNYEMPSEEDTIYLWPDDLFKPDVVFLLNVSEEVRKERQSRRKNVTIQEDLLNNCPEFRRICTHINNMKVKMDVFCPCASHQGAHVTCRAGSVLRIIIQAYKNMKNPPVTFMNGDLGFGPILRHLLKETRHLINNE